MIFEGFKIGDVVGSPGRHWDSHNKRWLRGKPNQPGLQIQDITEDGIKVRQKEVTELHRFKYPELLHEIQDFITERKRGKIFSISASRVEQVARYYAKKSGLNMHDMVRPQMFVDFSRSLKHENLIQLLGLEFTVEQLSRLIQEGEGLELEFKREIGGNYSEFCETMVSFANLRGGKILIGVEDNGTINGVVESQVSKLDDIITSISHQYCDPFVHHTLKTVLINETRVVVVRIDEGTDKPYWLKDKGPMIRTGPHHGGARDRLMTRQEAEQAFRGSIQKSSG